MILVWASLSMVLKDACGTLLVIAEARGRALLAGLLDAAGDLALVLTTLFGAGQVIVHGWDARSFEVLGVIMLTSLLGTTFWTRVGRRITDHGGNP
jgi:hypothetical protein